MAEPQDTEITLGTGKMLALFFGLVALCSGFFALGFRMGRNSAPGIELGSSLSTTPGTSGGPRAPAVKPATSPQSDLTFYKSVGQDAAQSQMPTSDNAGKAPAAGGTPAGDATPADPMAAPPLNSYFVQVAAVSKQEDADALVDALKKKQYSAFAATLPDKLFHVQVGPFTDIKDAEATRARLVSDGYNPILKK